MSRFRRVLAVRSLLSRVESLEETVRGLQEELERRRQFDDAPDTALSVHEQRLQLLEQERLLRALHSGAPHDLVQVEPVVPAALDRPYVCIAPAGTSFHPEWFAVAVSTLAAHPDAVAVYGAHVDRVGGELVWQFSRRLADGDSTADTPAEAVAMRVPPPPQLVGLSGEALVAALADCGVVIALPHPASLARGVLDPQ